MVKIMVKIMVKPKTEYDCFDIPIVQISVNKEVVKMATKRLNGEGSLLC